MPLAACDPCRITYVVGDQNLAERTRPHCGAPLRELSQGEAQEHLRQLADRLSPKDRPSSELNGYSL